MTALPMMMMSDEEVARYGYQGDAGFGALQTERGLLPLAALQVEARVCGVIASVEVAQTFVNTTGAAIEATYIFPLPDRAAVHKFTMEVGGRIIDGVVEERGVAREQYDQAIAAGHRAAITEEERGGVFTLRVGNLMPGESATVRLALVGPLPVDDGEVTFQFPLVVAPRYMPGSSLGGDQAGLGIAPDTDLVPDASRISPPVLLPGLRNPVRLALRVTLEDHHIREVASSLHAVTTANRDAHVVEVQPGERLNRDFILRWRLDGSALRSSLVCSDDPDGRGGSFLLTMIPPSTTAVAAKARDVVFVIDRSGSMGGWKMVAARRAAARMIDTLTSRDRFCAIAFDDRVEHIPQPQLVDATDRNRYRAVEALAKVDARGGTELAEPLTRAARFLAGGHDDRERVIVLVTDGQVGNEDHILRELAPNLRKVRMFTLGIDQAVNAAFLKRLASAGGGLCELVESEDRLDAVMAKVHRRIGTPIATELVLREAGLEIDHATVAPKRLPDVYAGAPVTILGRYRGRAAANAAIELEGTSLGDPLRVRITREPESGHAAWLASSWARSAIRDKEDQYAAGVRGGIEREIVRISKEYSVLSRFTAFLAIDRSQIANAGGYLKQVVQPVEQPEGWEASMAPPTGGGMRAPRPAAMTPMPSPPMSSLPVAKSMRASMSAPPPPLMGPAAAAPVAPGHGGDARGRIAMDDEDAFDGPPMAAPPPMPPMAPRRESKKEKAEEKLELEAERSITGSPAAFDALASRDGSGSAYHAQLAALARELDAQGRGRADAAAIRVLRQRLTEWCEDVRSTGASGDLASAVEQLVQRLSAALAATTNLAGEAIAIAAELIRLANGATPPRAPTKSRAAFWK